MQSKTISPKGQYIDQLKSFIKRTLDDDYVFQNYKNQIFAKKLGVEFNSTFNEQYLWRKALNLSSNACFLIKESAEKDLAIRALKESAEIYEYLHSITKEYDVEYLLILSALCYDIAGYQANALCLIRDLIHQKQIYEFSSFNGDKQLG